MLKLENVEVRLADIQSVTTALKFDVGLALHACGMLSDVVLELCLRANASFVLVCSSLFLFMTSVISLRLLSLTHDSGVCCFILFCFG